MKSKFQLLAKEILREAFPRSIAYVMHLKALFQNEAELRLLPLLCNRHEVAIDVGAFTGTYTIGLNIFARRVIAVEPQPRQAALLRGSMPQNVTVIESALSNESGIGKMRLSSPGGGSMSSLALRDGMDDWTEIVVAVGRLDDLCKDRVGFIKIDAEGHETEVLRGAKRLLDKDRPNLLIEAEERNGKGSVERVVGVLKEYGYDAYFVRRESILPISEFDLSTDQNLKYLVGGTRRAYRDYINSFIFLHPARGTKIPAHLPSSYQALSKTIVSSIEGAKT